MLDSIKYENVIDIPVGTTVYHMGTKETGIVVPQFAHTPQPGPDMVFVQWEDTVLWERMLTLQFTLEV